MKRRIFLSGAASVLAAPMIISLPRTAFAATYNPADFGAIGVGSDTAAINAAIAAIRSDGGGILQLNNIAGYDVGPINATNCKRMRIEIDPVCVVRGSQMVYGNQAPVFDLSRSPECEVHGGTVYAGTGDPWSPSPPSVLPLCLFYIAGGIDKVRLVNMKINGWCQSGMVAICSSVSVTLDHCQIMQRQGYLAPFASAPPALVLSSDPGEWGLRSIFATALPNLGYVNDIDIINTEIHQLATGTGGWTTYLRNANHVSFLGGLSDCSMTGHMLFQGVNDDVTLFSPKFYSEMGIKPQYVFQSQGTITNLAAYNPWPNNISSACSTAPFAGMSGTGVQR